VTSQPTPTPPVATPTLPPSGPSGFRAGDWRFIVLFLLSRLARVHITWGELRERTYPVDALPQYHIDAQQAELLFNLQREDSAHTDEKVKQLLTLSASLAALIVAFARDVHPRWLLVLLLALLVACVYLCISIFDVRIEQTPKLEDADGADAANQWAKDLAESRLANRARHQLRVDRFRAASRYFIAAFLLTPLVAYFAQSKPDAVAALRPTIDRMDTALERLGQRVDSLSIHGVTIHQDGIITVRPAPGTNWVAPPARSSRAQGTPDHH